MVADRIKRIFCNHRSTLRSIVALATLAILVTLIAVGLFANVETTLGASIDYPNDLTLYTSIIKHVQDGESYYTAAIRELRNGNYPLHPFVTVRPPAHALAMAVLP